MLAPEAVARGIGDGNQYGGVAFVYGINVFDGLMQDNSKIPDTAIICRGYGGVAPSRTFHSDKREVRKPKVQVTLRVKTEDYGGAIVEALYAKLKSATFGSYQDCKSQQSEFQLLGEDSKHREIWVNNYELMIAD